MARLKISESAFFKKQNFDHIDAFGHRVKVNRNKELKEARRLNRILNSFFGYNKVSYEVTVRKINVNFGKNLKSQRCIVKCRWGDGLKKHLRFLKTYLPQNSKKEVIEKPKLFSSLDVGEDFVERYEKHMSREFYKFIVSPENTNVDRKALVRAIINSLEKKTGYKFFWVAAEHTNTEHPHVHILINGVDKNGKNVKLTNYERTVGIREDARKFCTELVGLRTDDEIKAELESTPVRKSYTRLDTILESNEIADETLEGYSSVIETEDQTLIKRLLFLESLGFCLKRNKKFYMENNWKENLKVASRYNTFIDEKNQLGKENKKLYYWSPNVGRLKGTVVKLYKMNYEESWNNAIVFKDDESGRYYFVGLWKEPKDYLLGAKGILVASDRNRPLFKRFTGYDELHMSK